MYVHTNFSSYQSWNANLSSYWEGDMDILSLHEEVGVPFEVALF